MAKWFDDGKVFSITTPDDGGKDVLAHHTELRASGCSIRTAA